MLHAADVCLPRPVKILMNSWRPWRAVTEKKLITDVKNVNLFGCGLFFPSFSSGSVINQVRTGSFEWILTTLNPAKERHKYVVWVYGETVLSCWAHSSSLLNQEPSIKWAPVSTPPTSANSATSVI